jgi:hypothetical protein
MPFCPRESLHFASFPGADEIDAVEVSGSNPDVPAIPNISAGDRTGKAKALSI